MCWLGRWANRSQDNRQMKNILFTGDNLYVMHGMNSESVDLIYLDPPFNSKRMFQAPIGSRAAGASFKDMWSWNDVDKAYLEMIIEKYPYLVQFIQSVSEIHGTAMMSYLTYMAQRILEMHRLLKPSGGLYLHCDPTASHYLKIVLDRIFGKNNFRNEITWRRYAAHSLSKSAFDSTADILFVYSKDAAQTVFNHTYVDMTDEAMKVKFPHIESETGRKFQHVALEQSSNRTSAGESRMIDGKKITSQIGWRWQQKTFDERSIDNPHIIYWTKAGRPRYKIYADEYKGAPLGSIWTDIPPLSSGDKERTGYPTQKPLALLRRIISASSNPGDIVFDPFCGCATTMVAAQQLGRHWIGIDIAEKSADLVMERLADDSGLFTNFVHRTDMPVRTDIKEEPATATVRERLYDEQQGKCNACNQPMEARHLELDHIIPKSKTGGNYYANYQLLCGNCNRVKGDRPMEYLMAKIQKRVEAMKYKVSFGKGSEE